MSHHAVKFIVRLPASSQASPRSSKAVVAPKHETLTLPSLQPHYNRSLETLNLKPPIATVTILEHASRTLHPGPGPIPLFRRSGRRSTVEKRANRTSKCSYLQGLAGLGMLRRKVCRLKKVRPQKHPGAFNAYSKHEVAKPTPEKRKCKTL